MKKVFLFVLLMAMSTVAQGADMDDVQFGVDGKLAGCFCCVEQTCVVAKNETDCKKIGGVKIKNCKECAETTAPNG
jgi:hypothetical protein